MDFSTCEAFDSLNGSRIAIASAEFRFPLLGLFSRRSFYGPFPIDRSRGKAARDAALPHVVCYFSATSVP